MKRKTRIRMEKKFVIWQDIIANQIFNDYCYSGDLEKTIEQIKFHRGVLKAMRNHLIKTNTYPDTRITCDGYEYKSIEQIEGNLSYISDRFISEIRLIWLINLPEQITHILK